MTRLKSEKVALAAIVIAAALAAALIVTLVTGSSKSSRTAAPSSTAAGTSAPSAGTSTPSSAAAGGPSPRFFAADSAWNKPLPADTPIDPSSPRLVAALAAEWRHEGQINVGPWVSTDSYSTPLYTVPANQPNVPVKLDNVQDWNRSLQVAFERVPIPRNAHPAKGTDAHMTIYQPSTDRLWEFWTTRKQADGWHAGTGGAIEHVSKSTGYYTTDSWPGANSRWGATATSLPVIAGTMLINELKAGHINHALALALPAPRAGVYAWPAQRGDGFGGADTIPEGAHLRLDPKLDLSKLHLPAITLMMAEAAQRYGIIVRDKTGQALNFFAEDPTPTATSPYVGPRGLFDGLWPYQFLGLAFPYTHLQVLKMKLCSNQFVPCTGP